MYSTSLRNGEKMVSLITTFYDQANGYNYHGVSLLKHTKLLFCDDIDHLY